MGPVVEVKFPIIGKVWATTTQQLADRILKDNATFTQRRDDGGVVAEPLPVPPKPCSDPAQIRNAAEILRRGQPALVVPGRRGGVRRGT